MTETTFMEFQLRESPWVARLKRTPWPITWYFTLPDEQLYVGLRDRLDQDVPIKRQPVRFRVANDGTVRNSNEVNFVNDYDAVIVSEFVFWTLPIDGAVVGTESCDMMSWHPGEDFHVSSGYFTPRSSKPRR